MKKTFLTFTVWERLIEGKRTEAEERDFFSEL